MHGYILHLWQAYGYWGLMGAMALEYSIVLPVPAETTLTATGILYQQHVLPMKLIWLITATSMGTFAGATIAYFIGRLVGRPFFERFGKYIRLTPERFDKFEQTFQKYTIPTLVISRYIAFVRIFVPYIAGINRVRLIIFVPTVLLTSFAWTASFILAGSVIDRALIQVVHHWKVELVPAIIVLLALVVGYWYFHRWLNRKIHGTGDDGWKPHATPDSATAADSVANSHGAANAVTDAHCDTDGQGASVTAPHDDSHGADGGDTVVGADAHSETQTAERAELEEDERVSEPES